MECVLPADLLIDFIFEVKSRGDGIALAQQSDV